MELENEGQGFIWWYFKKLTPLSADEIEEALCDGGGDLGIDAIFKDVNEIVHFYQFKYLKNYEKGYPTGDVDKTIGGLELIMRGKHEEIANEKLKLILKDVLETIPLGYQLHFVSTGNGLEREATTKAEAFLSELKISSNEYFKYVDENVVYLHNKFYTKILPTLDKSITLDVRDPPYMVGLAHDHNSYLFHLHGGKLAELYNDHRERILQQNIRMFEGENPTNEAIYRSCTMDEPENFYHYNNGITILCDSAKWDPMKKRLEIVGPQIVNGGQTVRILHRAMSEGKLNDEVYAVVRVITSQGDKQFAGNVAVNLNNQTRVQGSFLKSNNPSIVQLASSLTAIGWFLERRDGEVEELTDSEKTKIEIAISGTLEEKSIPLKEGTQAYVATFYQNPGLARKDPAKMFLSVSEGGHFEKIFSTEMTAENFARSYELYRSTEDIINKYKKIKRRKKHDSDWKKKYGELFGHDFVGRRANIIDQMVPQSTIFLISLCYEEFIKKRKMDWDEMLHVIKSHPENLGKLLDIMITCQECGGDDLNKTWQTLLKSQEFFKVVSKQIHDIEA